MPRESSINWSFTRANCNADGFFGSTRNTSTTWPLRLVVIAMLLRFDRQLHAHRNHAGSRRLLLRIGRWPNAVRESPRVIIKLARALQILPRLRAARLVQFVARLDLVHLAMHRFGHGITHRRRTMGAAAERGLEVAR